MVETRRRGAREQQAPAESTPEVYDSAADEEDLDAEAAEDPDYVYSESEEEEGEGSGEEVAALETTGNAVLWRVLGMASPSNASQARLQRFPPISSWEPPPLDHELAAELVAKTAAVSPRVAASGPALPRPRSASGVDTPRSSASGSGGLEGARGGVLSPHALLLRRESGGGPLGASQKAHFAGFHRLPTRPSKLAHQTHSRGYIGRFDAQGNVFVAAFQDEKKIKLFDVHNNWRIIKSCHARQLRWTVTDTALSSDQRFLLYSTISSTVHLVNVERGAGPDGEEAPVESVANITQVHEALQLGEGDERNGLWSIRWSPDNREIVAGTGDASVWVYDVQAGRTTVRAQGHQDDVNAVAYADSSPHVFFSGSDDHMVKAWDRRLMDASGNRRRSQPTGVLVGHTEGVTHIDSKGDGRYLISNSKDQTVRLWDLRAARAPKDAARLSRKEVPSFHWDYRWQSYPAHGRVVAHPHDGSIRQFRGGHQVRSTLIRAYWSPAATTGQRYILAGSSDGCPCVYDVISGKPIEKLQYHRECVRDLSWHPTLPMLATVSFDGSICLWEPDVPGEKEAEVEAAEEMAEARSPGSGAARAARGRHTLPRPAADQLGDWW